MLRILEERAFPVSELRAYASQRSLGRKLPFAGGEVTCEVLAPGCFDGLDLVIVDVDDPLAAEWAPLAAAAGARVVDNSAAFRMDPDVPLVIAEVNPDDLAFVAEGHRVVPQLHHDDPRHRARAAAPRGAHRSAGRVDVSVGVGCGPGRPARARRAVDEALRAQRGVAARAGTLDAPVVEGEVWPKPIAGNVIPLAGSVKEEGYTSEEWKMIHETRKILHDDDIRCTVTCVRVPVYVGHAVSANVRFHRPMSKAEAVEMLRDAPGVRLVDDGDGYPDAARCRGYRPVLVGRVREDGSEPGSINLWITGDNLRKGAALNAVQLAELLLAVAGQAQSGAPAERRPSGCSVTRGADRSS